MLDRHAIAGAEIVGQLHLLVTAATGVEQLPTLLGGERDAEPSELFGRVGELGEDGVELLLLGDVVAYLVFHRAPGVSRRVEEIREQLQELLSSSLHLFSCPGYHAVL